VKGVALAALLGACSMSMPDPMESADTQTFTVQSVTVSGTQFVDDVAQPCSPGWPARIGDPWPATVTTLVLTRNTACVDSLGLPGGDGCPCEAIVDGVAGGRQAASCFAVDAQVIPGSPWLVTDTDTWSRQFSLAGGEWPFEQLLALDGDMLTYQLVDYGLSNPEGSPKVTGSCIELFVGTLEP
jgi:hypothetical protein